MPLLVEGLCPELTSDAISQLKSIEIHTATEFMTFEIEDLSKKCKILYKVKLMQF